MDIGESIWIVVKRVLDIPGMVYALLLLPLVLLFLGVLLSMRGYVRYFITWENALKDAADERGSNSGRGRVPRRDSERRRAYLLKAVFKNLRLENPQNCRKSRRIRFSLRSLIGPSGHRRPDASADTEFPSAGAVEC